MENDELTGLRSYRRRTDVLFSIVQPECKFRRRKTVGSEEGRKEDEKGISQMNEEGVYTDVLDFFLPFGSFQ